ILAIIAMRRQTKWAQRRRRPHEPVGSLLEEIRHHARPAYEPEVWSSAFTRSGPPEGETPNRLPTIGRFIVPLHAQKRKEAAHEVEGGHPVRSGFACGNAVRGRARLLRQACCGQDGRAPKPGFM